jgi:hypothetical protein
MKIGKLERLQSIPLDERLSRWARQIEECPFLAGVVVEAALQTGVPKAITHTLQNKPQGAFVLSVNVPACVAVTDIGDRTITLTANADCMVKVWVW